MPIGLPRSPRVSCICVEKMAEQNGEPAEAQKSPVSPSPSAAGIEPGVGQRLLHGAERVDAVRGEAAEEFAVDGEMVGPAPVAPVGGREGEALDRAGDLDGQVGVAEELDRLEPVPQFAQAAQHGGAVVTDAGDEPETGDDGQRRHAEREELHAAPGRAATLRRMNPRRSSSVRTWTISSFVMLMPNKSSAKKTTSVMARESKPRSSIRRVLPGSSASERVERRGLKSARMANTTVSSIARVAAYLKFFKRGPRLSGQMPDAFIAV